MLGPARFLEISETIARHFDVGAHTEHAIELDPRLLAEPLVEALARAGVNRASLGVRISIRMCRRRPGAFSPTRLSPAPWSYCAVAASRR